MELRKKTTILFNQDEYQQLKEVAKARHSSVGSLVREACEIQYGLHSRGSSKAAVERLANLGLSVSDTGTMKKQSVPSPGELLQ